MATHIPLICRTDSCIMQAAIFSKSYCMHKEIFKEAADVEGGTCSFPHQPQFTFINNVRSRPIIIHGHLFKRARVWYATLTLDKQTGLQTCSGMVHIVSRHLKWGIIFSDTVCKFRFINKVRSRPVLN